MIETVQRAHVLVNFEVDTMCCVRKHTHVRTQTYIDIVFVWRRNVKSQTTHTYTTILSSEHRTGNNIVSCKQRARHV